MSAVIRGLMPCILSAPYPEAVATPDLAPALVPESMFRSGSAAESFPIGLFYALSPRDCTSVWLCPRCTRVSNLPRCMPSSSQHPAAKQFR